MAFLTDHVEIDDLGAGQIRQTINMRAIAYRAAGVLQRAEQSWEDSGDGALPHAVTRSPLRSRIANDARRRIYPIPDDDNSWLEIGQPFVKIGGAWTQVSLGTPARTGKTITWTRPQTITTITHGIHFVKLEIELRNGFVPEDGMIAFPVGIQNLTRTGTEIRKNGVPVMQLRPFIAYDAANESDIRPIAHQFTNLAGQPYLLLTLPSLAGMARPVIDPTLTLQPDGTDGIDTYMRSDNPINFGTATTILTGVLSLISYRALLKFDLTSLPANAVISSAILSLFLTTDSSTAATTWGVYRQKRAWVEAQATWDIYSTGNNWSTAGGFHTDDCEQTDIGSVAMSATETINQFKDIPLTPVTKTALDLGNGWLVKADEAINNTRYAFASSDNATAANRPKLVVTYTLPAGVPLFMASYRRRRES